MCSRARLRSVRGEADQRALCQDRRTDGGKGFRPKRSIAECKGQKGHDRAIGGDIRRQCRLMSLNRSTLYYERKAESEENLQLMRRLDEQFLKTPYYGFRQMVYHLKRPQGRPQEGSSSDGQNWRSSIKNCGLHLTRNRVYPYLLRGWRSPGPIRWVHGCHLHLDAIGQFQCLVAIMDWYSRWVLSWRLEHAGAVLLAKHSRKRSTRTILGRSPIRPGESVHQHGVTNTQSLPGCVSDGRERLGGWTTFFIVGLGAHSEYESRLSELHSKPGRKPVKGSAIGSTYTKGFCSFTRSRWGDARRCPRGLKKHSERDLALRLAPFQNSPYWRQQELSFHLWRMPPSGPTEGSTSV